MSLLIGLSSVCLTWVLHQCASIGCVYTGDKYMDLF